MALGNAIMEWSVDYDPASPELATWSKVTDHNRAALATGVERIETKQRMADGTLRRYVVAKKRTWSTSWTFLPKNTSDVVVGTSTYPGTVDGGMGGADIEAFHDANDGEFYMRLMGADGNETLAPLLVMISDFNRDVTKRSPGGIEFWELSITLEEV